MAQTDRLPGRRAPLRPFLPLVAACLVAACGGGGGESAPAAAASPMPPASAPTSGVVLRAPVLSFTDTGLSVSDGITRNGLWSVATDQDWEFSLDMGRSWTRGTGNWFEVTGDGPKTIWVRARDNFGNTSEVVVVRCELDTQPPAAVAVNPVLQGVTRTLGLVGLEPGARWEYSLDGLTGWTPGTGPALGVLGNDLTNVWLRQMDIAGNVSAAQSFALDGAGSPGGHEASGDPLRPSVLGTGTQTLLIHGSVVRGDADYVQWDIPAGQRLESVKLVRYQSDDLIAFYALQRAAVFDAGVDVTRMLVYGHMGPSDLSRNVVQGQSASALAAGPMTLWFQQTGTLVTRYAIEVRLQTVP